MIEEYRKSFMHLLNSVVFNCFILQGKLVGGFNTQLEFRKKFIISLIENHCVEHAKRGRPMLADVAPLNERHFPNFVPPSEKKHNATRRCKVCAENGKRSKSRYQCNDCDVGLSVAPCFILFHTKKNYKN